MEVFCDDRQTEFKIDDDFIKAVLKTVAMHFKIDKPYQVSLSFVDNEEIRRLNSLYRKKDYATDVLSFPQIYMEHGKEIQPAAEPFLGGFFLEEILLGDVVISTDKVLEQSEEYGHSFEKELTFLFIHGLLHLLGYDHEISKEEEDMMFQIQDDIISELKASGIIKE